MIKNKGLFIQIIQWSMSTRFFFFKLRNYTIASCWQASVTGLRCTGAKPWIICWLDLERKQQIPCLCDDKPPPLTSSPCSPRLTDRCKIVTSRFMVLCSAPVNMTISRATDCKLAYFYSLLPGYDRLCRNMFPKNIITHSIIIIYQQRENCPVNLRVSS